MTDLARLQSLLDPAPAFLLTREQLEEAQKLASELIDEVKALRNHQVILELDKVGEP